ncbi:hypothetical protein AgCh_024765 [Apium graveolens]
MSRLRESGSIDKKRLLKRNVPGIQTKSESPESNSGSDNEGCIKRTEDSTISGIFLQDTFFQVKISKEGSVDGMVSTLHSRRLDPNAHLTQFMRGHFPIIDQQVQEDAAVILEQEVVNQEAKIAMAEVEHQ